MISRRSFANKKWGQKNRPYVFRIGIEITDKKPLILIQKQFGGNIYTRPNRRAANRKITYTWYLNSLNAMSFLKKIQKFLCIKKEQARLAIKYQEHVDNFRKNNPNYRNDGLSKKELNFRETIVQKIRSINSFNNLRKNL